MAFSAVRLKRIDAAFPTWTAMPKRCRKKAPALSSRVATLSRLLNFLRKTVVEGPYPPSVSTATGSNI